jgi:class 3 adenylate cyclase
MGAKRVDLACVPHLRRRGHHPSVVDGLGDQSRLLRRTDKFVCHRHADALSRDARPLPPGLHSANDILDLLMAEVVGFVAGKQKASADERVLRTILFTDIDRIAVCPRRHTLARHQLDVHDNIVDTVLARYGGRRANHTGDGIFALFDGPTKHGSLRVGTRRRPAARGIPIRRAGVHVGECERRGDQWSGVAVHVGARITALDGAGQVFASRTVRDLCAGSDLVFEDASLYLAKRSAAQC